MTRPVGRNPGKAGNSTAIRPVHRIQYPRLAVRAASQRSWVFCRNATSPSLTTIRNWTDISPTRRLGKVNLSNILQTKLY